MDDEEFELLRETCSSHSVANPKDIEALKRFRQERLERKERLAEEEATAGVESPAEMREKIAQRLGRTPKGLDSWVSKWKKEHGVDLPWVVRIPGVSAIYKLDETFEEWMNSYSGKQAKSKRGRPPKK